MNIPINKLKVAKLLKGLTEKYYGQGVADETGLSPIDVSLLLHQKKAALRVDRLESLAKMMKVRPSVIMSAQARSTIRRIAK